MLAKVNGADHFVDYKDVHGFGLCWAICEWPERREIALKKMARILGESDVCEVFNFG